MSGADKQDAVNQKQAGRPPVNRSDKPQNVKKHMKVCGHCFAKLYPGCRHSPEMCVSRRSKAHNLEKLIELPVTKERFAARTIASGTPLSTLGSKSRHIQQPVSPGQKESLFSVVDISHMQQELNLSNGRTELLYQSLREVLESNLKRKLFETNHQLNYHFELHILSCQAEGQELNYFDQWIVVCNNLHEFTDLVTEKRCLSEELASVKIGIDGGRGFCLSELSKERDSTHKKQFKDSGVKKYFVIGIVPNVPENYINLKRL